MKVVIKAPRGNNLRCLDWPQEAAMRMLMNNLDNEVAENPSELIVYGGSGKAARNWDAYYKIIQAEEARKELKALYSVLKNLDEYIKFVLITGVSKFSKVSLFSGLNQLEDISLNKDFGNICGYTQQELEFYFKDYLQGLNLDEIKEWYNGYYFLRDTLYNPFDILLYLKNKVFRNYWYETGTPQFIIKLIKEKEYNIVELENLRVDEGILNKFDIEDIAIEAIMFQTGYLTIKKRIESIYGEEYILCFPNKEVKIAFNNVSNRILDNKKKE